MARSLPPVLRDILLAFPALLSGLRNAVLPIPAPPARTPVPRRPPPPAASTTARPPRQLIEASVPAMQMPEPMSVSQQALRDARLRKQNRGDGLEQEAAEQDDSGSDFDASSLSGTVSEADLDFESGEDHDHQTGGTWVSLRERQSNLK